MKIVVAPDKFKGSLTAISAARAIQSAILSIVPHAEVITLPLADGGEGFAEIFGNDCAKRVECNSFDALMREISSDFIVTKQRFVVLELSEICGLMMLKQSERNPEKSTTYGLGVVINQAISLGYRDFIIGIGGSATNDCGIGMISALGGRFLDCNNKLIDPIGGNLSKIERIDTIDLERKIEGCTFTVACDVSNTLYGDKGAAMVYAAQKGADNEMIKRLDNGLRHFCNIVKQDRNRDMNSIIGGGAAGGIGAAFSCFLSAKMVSGSKLIADKLHLKDQIASADFVISAEGKIDAQSFYGKVVGEVCRLSKQSNVPVVLLCGVVDKEITKEILKANGVISCLSIRSKAPSQESSIKNAEIFLKEITKEALKEFYTPFIHH